MSDIVPAFAVVRPRATRAGSPDPQPLEEMVAELADEGVHGAIPLVGPPGSGKSTALAHLAAIFGYDDRLIFLDEPAPEEIQRRLVEANDASDADALLIFSAPSLNTRRPFEISLAPWGFDELIEYLLAEHPAACGSVLERLGPAARRLWSPRLATIVLDRFAKDPEADDVLTELTAHVDGALPDARLRQAVRVYCLTLILKGAVSLEDVFLQQVHAECGDVVRPLLRHPTVQLPLAADRVAWTLSTGSTVELKQPLPADLVEAVATRCGNDTNAVIHLRKVLRSGPDDNKHAMAASILLAIDPTWTPHSRPYGVWKLRGGYFSGARWPHVNLTGAALDRADFSDAQLDHANFAEAALAAARFDGARLAHANLSKSTAVGASFTAAALPRAKLSEAQLYRADLSDADLTGADLLAASLIETNLASTCFKGAQLIRARLTGASVTDADFTEAMLYETDLSSLDLRTVRLDGATLTKANLSHAQLEDVTLLHAQLNEANLRGAHLTGSRLPAADLRGADLRNTGLAEIHWEAADLRDANLTGATFHMGSSRSGLVGSPYACEGSKTGFYTDDYEDMHFKRPEEIRKANLRGADLRGANITDLDFYLVDLRDARLDPHQLTHVRKCGAILDDVLA